MYLNSLWHSNTIWRQRSWSTLILTSPRHSLSYYRRTLNEIIWHSRAMFSWILKYMNPKFYFKMCHQCAISVKVWTIFCKRPKNNIATIFSTIKRVTSENHVVLLEIILKTLCVKSCYEYIACCYLPSVFIADFTLSVIGLNNYVNL